jgi:hypothetical protein
MIAPSRRNLKNAEERLEITCFHPPPDRGDPFFYIILSGAVERLDIPEIFDRTSASNAAEYVAG